MKYIFVMVAFLVLQLSSCASSVGASFKGLPRAVLISGEQPCPVSTASLFKMTQSKTTHTQETGTLGIEARRLLRKKDADTFLRVRHIDISFSRVAPLIALQDSDEITVEGDVCER